MKKRNRLIGLITFLLFSGMVVMPSCEKDNDDTDESTDLTLDITGLPQLDEVHTYEGWLIVNNTPVSTGKFSIDNNGAPNPSTFSAGSGDLTEATAFFISIEPSPDPAESPTDIHLLAGSFIGTSANLSIEHANAIGSGFASVAGKYILATPTDGNSSNELSGIWWMDPERSAKSLILPQLNDGWMYEGWVIINGLTVSTGKFSDPSMGDDNDVYSLSLEAPDFPGEDFLTNAPPGSSFPLDLSGEEIFISVEPEPDNSLGPFAIKPLTAEIPITATDHELYNMNNNSDAISIFGEVSY